MFLGLVLGLLGALVGSFGSTGDAEEQSAIEFERQLDREFVEIASLLDLSTPGKTVADIGAGSGAWSVRLASRLAPTGRVIATEVVEDRVRMVQNRARADGLLNLTSVLTTQTDTGLPADCCDAALLRLVCHDFGDQAAMRRGIAHAVKPGGLMLVIDFEPSVAVLVRDMGCAGFRHERTLNAWRGDPRIYAVLLRRVP